MTQNETTKRQFEDIYDILKSEFEKDCENPVILYYLCLASLLTKKITQCIQVLKLFRTIHSINQTKKSQSIVANFFLAKVKHIEKLITKTPRLIG